MKSLLLWLWLAQAGDAMSTCQALRSGRFTEGNPLLPSSCTSIVIGKSIVTTALTVLGQTRPHHRAVKWGVAIVATAGPIGAAINFHRELH